MTPAEKLRESIQQHVIEWSDGESEESRKERREKSKKGQRVRNAKKKKAGRRSIAVSTDEKNVFEVLS